jgi:hypothetical protein
MVIFYTTVLVVYMYTLYSTYEYNFGSWLKTGLAPMHELIHTQYKYRISSLRLVL